MNSRYLKFIVPLIILLGVIHAYGQNTATITGTVTDTSAQVWGFATWAATLNNPSGGTPVFISGGNVPRTYTGQLDVSGTFTSGSVVGRTSQILPTGTSWTFTLYSLTSAPPTIVSPPVIITGTTYAAGGVLSTNLIPPIVPSSNLSYAYNTTEISNPVNGNGYVNTIANTNFLYNNGWVQIGGASGGCTGGSVTGNVAFNNQIGTFQSGCLSSVGNPFAMGLSCSQSGQRETGDATTNPFNCTLSYSNGTPASATLGDGTHTDTLTTPFTSGSLAFAYSTNTTFTAHSTATNAQTASATSSVTFVSRTFGGVGTAGATGATASGTSAILVGATGTLASGGLGNQASYGPYSPSNQSIYILNLSGTCTFTSGGFNFPMNTPTSITFVNQFGASVPMFLYQSTNLLSASFTLVPTC
jgi:hypothetical protein